MINVEIENKELELMLVKSIDHIHADKISRMIMMHLSKDPTGMGQLFKAFLGIIPETSFLIGDVIRVPIEHLPKWRMDLGTMQSNGMLHKNHLSCKITGIDLSRASCLSISFVYIDNNGKEYKDSYEVPQNVSVIEDEMFFSYKDDEEQLPF